MPGHLFEGNPVDEGTTRGVFHYAMVLETLHSSFATGCFNHVVDIRRIEYKRSLQRKLKKKKKLVPELTALLFLSRPTFSPCS